MFCTLPFFLLLRLLPLLHHTPPFSSSYSSYSDSDSDYPASSPRLHFILPPLFPPPFLLLFALLLSSSSLFCLASYSTLFLRLLLPSFPPTSSSSSLIFFIFLLIFSFCFLVSSLPHFPSPLLLLPLPLILFWHSSFHASLRFHSPLLPYSSSPPIPSPCVPSSPHHLLPFFK